MRKIMAFCLVRILTCFVFIGLFGWSILIMGWVGWFITSAGCLAMLLVDLDETWDDRTNWFANDGIDCRPTRLEAV